MKNNYAITQNKPNACLASFKVCFVLVALLFASSLRAQNLPELVSDVPRGPKYLTVYNGKLFFYAIDKDIGGAWLWSTDGTTTQIRGDIVKIGNNGLTPYYLTVLGDQLIFSAFTEERERELFKFDGNETSLIKDIYPDGESFPEGFTAFNGKLYFQANDGVHGGEPWFTDGTENGTQMLKDIGSYLAGAPLYFTEFNGKLYFSAYDDTHGRELWVTNGANKGTQLVVDINKGDYQGSPDSSSPTHLTAFNGKLYFGAVSKGDKVKSLHQIWVTDGTENGTRLLKSGINTGAKARDLSKRKNFFEYQEKLYFFGDDGTHGFELWVTDGTESGTRLLKDIRIGSGSSNPSIFTEYKGKLYFRAFDETYGYELWMSDGTENGTQLVKDINPGFDGSYPSKFTEYNGKLYFIAATKKTGYELWEFDGTPDGISMIPSNFPGLLTGLNYKEDLVVAGGSLYFVADYDGEQDKLYKLTTNNLSLKEHKKSEFTAYPNPVQDILHLETKTNSIQKIELFSITGQRLKTWEGQSKIDMSQFAPGNYFVKLIANDGSSETKQIIKTD